jgi:hypothetical protein
MEDLYTITVLDLIKASMRLIGAVASGEAPTAQEATDVRQVLNLLLQEWHNEGLISQVERQSFATVSGVGSYVIGNGSTWNGNKPLQILSAVVKDSSDTETPLRLIGDEEYNRISDKTTFGTPDLLYYLAGALTGTIYLNSVPDAVYTVTIVNQKPFSVYDTLTEDLIFPNGYISALKYALAVEIAPEFGQQPNGFIIQQAEKKKAQLKSSNLKRPAPIRFYNPTGRSGATFNIYTGEA